MSDYSQFTGTVRFGPPYYDNDGRFTLTKNTIIVNPNGPGIGPNRTTITDHITLEAIPEGRVGR
jgi:flagellar basal body rod protein FlgG